MLIIVKGTRSWLLLPPGGPIWSRTVLSRASHPPLGPQPPSLFLRPVHQSELHSLQQLRNDSFSVMKYFEGQTKITKARAQADSNFFPSKKKKK